MTAQVVPEDFELAPGITYYMMTQTNEADLQDQNRIEGMAFVSNLRRTAQVFLRVCEATGDSPADITSCYRCEALNTQVGGSPLSQHRFALAVDWTPGCLAQKTVAAIEAAGIAFHQLLFEPSCLHLGLATGTNDMRVGSWKRAVPPPSSQV